MLYKVTRTDGGARWDEFNAVIIRARSIDAAFKLATSATDESDNTWRIARFPGFAPDGSNLHIARVNPKAFGDAEVVLSSFNRG